MPGERNTHAGGQGIGRRGHGKIRAQRAISPGGQKQRIAIAGMLAMQPKVLVLDEATAMLNPKGRRDIIDLVTKLHKENGITVVMITQYMEEAIGADRVAVMSDGEN